MTVWWKLIDEGIDHYTFPTAAAGVWGTGKGSFSPPAHDKAAAPAVLSRSLYKLMILIDLDQSGVSQHCNNMIIAGNNPTAGILCSVCDAQIDSSTYCLVINFNSNEANLLF